MQIPRILVTGATGFVGQGLCRRLIDGGMNVHAAIRNEHSSLNTFSQEFEQFKVGNIDQHTDWRYSIKGVDVVLHLAARVHVMNDNVANPLAEFRKVNLHGTANLALQAARAGVKRFVYVSSIKVNGEYTISGQTFIESDSASPQDPYAISKWEAEQELRTISRNTGMEIVIVRPPLVYGPGVKANFARLLKIIDLGIPLPLGAIHNSRSLVYIDNLIDALVSCALHPAASGQLYLVSDGEDISTPRLLKTMASALNRPSRIYPVPVSIMRTIAGLLGKSAVIDRLTQSLVIDSAKIRNQLSWQPPCSIVMGMQATADWYRTINSRQGV